MKSPVNPHEVEVGVAKLVDEAVEVPFKVAEAEVEI